MKLLMYFRTLRRTAGEVSLSEPIETDRDGSSLALMDVISCEEDLAEQLDARDDRSRIYQSIFSVLMTGNDKSLRCVMVFWVSPRR